jgi:hypothetical protein
VVGSDVYGRFLICRGYDSRWNFLTGWNYTRVGEELQLTTRSTVLTDPTIAAGTVITTRDKFTARNEFNGAILGLEWIRYVGCWSTQAMLRTSIGGMHETALVGGGGSATFNGQTTILDGVFTGASNVGRRSRNEFTAITEANFNLAYRFNPCTQLTVGYTFMYWNDILAAGTGIDTVVGAAGATTRPQFNFRHSDFWVQGLSLGVAREF